MAKSTVPTLGAQEPVRHQYRPADRFPTRRFLMLLAAVCMAASVWGGAVSSASAEAASPSEHWVGVIEQHGDHFDYVGRACPVEVDVCVAIEARYRIIPVTPEAAQVLPTVAGGTASVEGFLIAVQGGGHGGLLIAERVSPTTAAA